jgi:hypothetical protein
VKGDSAEAQHLGCPGARNPRFTALQGVGAACVRGSLGPSDRGRHKKKAGALLVGPPPGYFVSLGNVSVIREAGPT